MFLKEIHPDTIEYVDSYAPNRSIRNAEIKPKVLTSNSLGLQKNKPSPFFDDISQNEESFSQIEPDGFEIRAGMKVIHGKFGKGTVHSVSGNGEKREAIVIFQGIGKKQLLLKYAKLQPDNS
jgi:DNA helicase-2/ATP-dependent DNA helicase PcrA